MKEKKGQKKNLPEYIRIYTEYYPLIFNAAYAKTHNEHDAGDICQEVFLIFFEKFDEIENKKSWLFGTLRNVLLRHYERSSKAPADIDQLGESADIAYHNGSRNTRILIREAIESAGLTEEEQLLIDYITIAEYSYRNVGKILGMTKRQVGYKYATAVKKIIAYLQTRGINNIEDLL